MNIEREFAWEKKLTIPNLCLLPTWCDFGYISKLRFMSVWKLYTESYCNLQPFEKHSKNVNWLNSKLLNISIKNWETLCWEKENYILWLTRNYAVLQHLNLMRATKNLYSNQTLFSGKFKFILKKKKEPQLIIVQCYG